MCFWIECHRSVTRRSQISSTINEDYHSRAIDIRVTDDINGIICEMLGLQDHFGCKLNVNPKNWCSSPKWLKATSKSTGNSEAARAMESKRERKKKMESEKRKGKKRDRETGEKKWNRKTKRKKMESRYGQKKKWNRDMERKKWHTTHTTRYNTHVHVTHTTHTAHTTHSTHDTQQQLQEPLLIPKVGAPLRNALRQIVL